MRASEHNSTGGRTFDTAAVMQILRKSAPFAAIALALLWIRQGDGLTLTASLVIVYAIVGASLVLLFGACGQMSLGHAIFLGAGAFTSANISGRTPYGLELELPAAVFIGFVLGIIVGLPSLRVAGLYLAIATFALSYAGQQLLIEFRGISNGASGMATGALTFGGVLFRDPRDLLYAGLAVLVVSFWLVHNLLRARTGRALNAIRTSETAAISMGINISFWKVTAFGISAALASTAGVFYIHTIAHVTPENFSLDLSILLLLSVIIGGANRLLGALLGAAFMIALPEVFRSVQQWEGILVGLILLVLLMASPDGLVGLVKARLLNGRRRRVGGRRAGSAPPVERTVRPSSAQTAPRATHEDPSVIISGGLVIEDLSVSFGGVKAVDHVSFDVTPGEVLGLIGSNGAGKTTLFNAVTGFVESSGTVLLDGGDITGQSPRHRSLDGIGRTFQNLNLHGDLDVLTHIMLGMHRFMKYDFISEMFRAPWVVRREREMRSRAFELLGRLNLDEFTYIQVDDLPYGIQKRVDVARALATEPKILLLDEPAAGLPSIEADQLVDAVLEIATEQGITTVLIEHNVELVRRVATRLVVMDAGQVIAMGQPAEVLSQRNVVEAYLGSAL